MAVVRAAAATTLGEKGAKSSAPFLKKALADKENQIFFTTSHGRRGVSTDHTAERNYPGGPHTRILNSRY